MGTFDRTRPRRNAQLLTRVAGPQIVDVYGVDCRSVPVFFLTDDHDYFENDTADQEIITFPPPGWKLRLARATQQIAPLEENGFLIADVTPDSVVLRFFRWSSTTQSEQDIDGLQPFEVLRLQPA